MPPDPRADLEHTLSRVEVRLERARLTISALSLASSGDGLRALARQAEADEAALIDLDNSLGTARDSWSEAEAAAALRLARERCRPFAALLGALLEAGAQDGENVGALADLVAALDVRPEPDPESEAGKVARRFAKVLERLDAAFAGLSTWRGGGRAT